jgi:transposase
MPVSERGGPGPSAIERCRRRLWSDEEKRRIVAETFAPSASVSVVARRHDLNANMLFTWRRQVGTAALVPAGEAVTFVSGAISAEPTATVSPASAMATGQIEIVLASGDRVIVGMDVGAAALTRVVKVLSRR